MDIFRYSSNVSQQNQINVAKLAYGDLVKMSFKAGNVVLTDTAVSVVTEDVALIAVTFIHFVMNVVAILITRIPIFATTCNFETRKCIRFTTSSISS